MVKKKNIFAIIGSASANSTNLKIVEFLASQAENDFNFTIFNELKSLPAFDPELSANHPPKEIVAFRKAIESADGIIICTPEYVFSIPAELKNAIEWCIATTVFSGKPGGLITASASGQKGHEQLKLIMQTAMLNFTEATSLLIPGAKGKLDVEGSVTDKETEQQLTDFIKAYILLLKEA